MREIIKNNSSRKKQTPEHRPVGNGLSGHDTAIHEYLESLLLEVDETDEVQGVVFHEEPAPVASVLGLEQLVGEIPGTLVETRSEPQTQQQTPIEVRSATAVPEWGQAEFQCLLFKVSGLSLAVPLVKLKSVIAWDEGITQTPNQTRWYLGLVKHLAYQVKVIDTALLVMPENYRKKIETDQTERLSHILLVDDYKWGLACDSIGEVIWLKPEDVKWRKNKTTRAWLSGTSLEHLCAIMDTEVFAQMLDKA